MIQIRFSKRLVIGHLLTVSKSHKSASKIAISNSKFYSALLVVITLNNLFRLILAQIDSRKAKFGKIR